jgi:hypothetical protein
MEVTGDYSKIVDTGEVPVTETGMTNVEPQAEMTILSCLSDIVENGSSRIGFNEKKFDGSVYTTCAEQIEYVSRMVDITPVQVILLAFIIEGKGLHSFDLHGLAGIMGLSYIKTLAFTKDLTVLAEKKLIHFNDNDRVCVCDKTIPILATNLPYAVPELSGLNTGEILKEIKSIIRSRENEEISLDDMLDSLDCLFNRNPEAGIVREAKALGFDTDLTDEASRVIFYTLVKRYIYDYDDDVAWFSFDDILDDSMEVSHYCNAFTNGELDIVRKKIAEPCNEEGLASTERLHLIDSVKEKLFADVGGMRKRNRRAPLKVTPPSGITAREMYYNDAEGGQVRRLTDLLSQEKYNATCERLRKSGMRTGFTCLFYGGPGTGKTESVYQIARATGRGIVAANVNEIKSCWVGESEKLIKGLFDRYRALVKESDVAPILLFNEADAIFGIRREGAENAVDKMENSIQNIILQEMESLDGILIATTNLTQNLDRAFERRFLYKIRFNKPCLDAKTKIWRYMIPDLSEAQARELARSYDFSGGQIENISRKKMIKSILDGVEPNFCEVKSYCGEELIDASGGEVRRIGFQSNS